MIHCIALLREAIMLKRMVARGLAKALVYGLIVAALYALLFANEESVMAWSRQGGWWFVLPIAIAFIFSVVHGSFTSQFWETLGVKAK